MRMDALDEFLVISKNSAIVIADYESRLGHLDAMYILKKVDASPIINHWIAAAQRRLSVLKPLYDASKLARELPHETLLSIHTQLRALNNE